MTHALQAAAQRPWLDARNVLLVRLDELGDDHDHAGDHRRAPRQP